MTAADIKNLSHQDEFTIVHPRGEFFCQFTGEVAQLLSDPRLVGHARADHSPNLNRIAVNGIGRLPDEEESVTRATRLADDLRQASLSTMP